MNKGEPQILVKDLTIAYGDFVLLKNLNFEINKGDVFIKVLKDRGIPVSAGSAEIMESDEVMTLIAILKIIDPISSLTDHSPRSLLIGSATSSKVSDKNIKFRLSIIFFVSFCFYGAHT